MKRKNNSLVHPPENGFARFLRSPGASIWLPGLALVVGTLIAYLPAWHAGFIWDDDVFLVGNPLIHAPDGLFRFWFTTEPIDYFPLTSTTLWLEWRLWAANPLGYHLVNVLLHALNAVLLWQVLRRLIPQFGMGAWLAAAVFALHPVNVESVAWITERKNTLAMFFYAVTLLCYLEFEDSGERRWHRIALGAFGLALLSKTAVAPLPLVLLGLAWWRRGRVTRRDVWHSIPFFAAAALLGLVTVWFQHHRDLGSDVVRADSFYARLAGAGWAVWFYLCKAALPVNLAAVYPRWRIDAGNALSYVPGLLAVAGLALCWRYRRRWGRAWLFGLGYFLVMLLPVLGFLNISFMQYSLVADRWQYFAILGPIAMAVAGLRTGRAVLGKGRALVEPVICVSLLCVLGVLTWRQAGIYRDVETFWEATLARNPDCPIAHNNLGAYLLEKDRVDEATAHFDQVLQRHPDDASAHNNLGNALLRQGQVKEALDHYEKAVKNQPDFALARVNLGSLLLQGGQVDEAIAQFQKAVDSQPDLAEAQYNLGTALLQIGRVDEAIAHLQRAVDSQPDFASAHYNLGTIYLQKGQLDRAIAQFQKALEIQPGIAQIHDNLGNALARKGQVQEAITHFQRALELDPNLPGVHINLANALLQLGRAHEAVAHYERALELRPDSAIAQKNLAWLLATCPEASVRNGARAVELAQRAAQRSGGNDPTTLGTLAAAYAEAGRFPEAVATARQALELATAQSNTAAADSLRTHLGFYQAGSPFRDTGQASTPASPARP